MHTMNLLIFSDKHFKAIPFRLTERSNLLRMQTILIRSQSLKDFQGNFGIYH